MKNFKRILSALLAVVICMSFAVTSFAAKYIGEAKAKEIALKDAGITANQAKYLTCSLDRDDRIVVYDVEFYYNRVEYNYEIEAKTGKILVAEKDGFDTNVPNPTVEYISKAEAKAIAFAHAKVNEADARKVKVKFDFDDGRAEFEVDFHADKYDYDYEIDAVSGQIIKAERDRDVDFSDIFFSRMFTKVIEFFRNLFVK